MTAITARATAIGAPHVPDSSKAVLRESSSGVASKPSAPADQRTGPLPSNIPPPLPADVINGKLQSSRQGSVEPYTLVEGPQAWYGKDYQLKFEDWAIRLSQQHIEELEAAIEGVLSKGVVQQEGNHLNLAEAVSQADFSLPTLGPVLGAVRQEVQWGRGFALLRGLPVDRWSRVQTLVAYWGIGLYWGKPMRQNQKGHLIGHVKDIGIDSKHQNPTTRIYLTSVAQPWHVDGADLVGLLCLKVAKSGGLSSIASSVTIHNELLRTDPELLEVAAGTWYLDRKNEVPAGKLPYYVLPILHYYQGYISTTFSDTYYQLAASRHPEVPALTPQQLRVLQRYNEIANRQDVRLDFWLEPGDLQLANNHTVMHTRSAYEDWEEADKRRHLLRLWLAPHDSKPLPDSYAELWGTTTPGDRGGIRIEGFEERIPLEAEPGNL